MSDDGIETAQRDLRRIMAELGMSLHARTESSHEVVLREVVPRIRELKAAEPNRPPAIDPADVKVGDVVEVEANDGSWLVHGEVIESWRESQETWWFSFRARGKSTFTKEVRDTTVRLVRRAEPEPDPEQVKALAAVLCDLPPISFDSTEDEARELVRRGVTVRKGATE